LIKKLLSFLAAAFLAVPASAEQMVHASLIAEQNGIVSGQLFRVGILLDMKEGWHTYWENPGDAGIPTTLEWHLPPGFAASSIDWPVPQRLTEGTLVTYAYTGNVLLPVTITPPAALNAGAHYPIKVNASWLVCKNICIPESAELELTLPVATNATSTGDAEWFAQYDRHRPRIRKEPLGYIVKDKQLYLDLSDLHIPGITSALFLPRQENVIDYAAAERLEKQENALWLAVAVKGNVPYQVSGILSVTAEIGEHKNYDITLTPFNVVKPEHAGQLATPLPVTLLLALLGGLILNLMPCVLPVLSLKALAIVKKGGHSHRAVVRQGLAYTLGIVVSFAVIAGVLIGLRDMGEAIGWGYQMQSPAFVGFLIYLLFMVGLSLSGVFHLPALLGNFGNTLAEESSAKASFFTGVLATAVATPCTAPFMASAVGIALTLPTIEALLVFEALGLGLALPFLLISLFPKLRRFLPRPGAWMETFRQLLAFPMYTSVIWLLWVLTLQTGADGMVVALSGMLAITVVVWMSSRFSANRMLALALYVIIIFLSLPMLERMQPGAAALSETNEVPFSKVRLEELRNAHKPVFVDVTAAWCITCQLNVRAAIHTPRTTQAFKDHGVTLMVADWTRRNDEITEFLSGFGYKGVPLYVFYPASGAVKILPQLLSEDKVIETISLQGE